MEKFMPFIGAFNVCQHNGILKAFQILGYALNIIKIIIPILIIGFGTVELGKAILANDDKAIKIAISSLIKKAIAGVVIFFLPTLITAVMSLIDNADDLNKFNCLTNCLKEPSECKGYEEDGVFDFN